MALTPDDAKRQDKILRCLRSEDGKAVVEWVTELCNRSVQQLKSVREPIDIGRHQGRVEAFEQILKSSKED